MKKRFRSSCAIASALDLIGDKWSLLIVRDMLLSRKKTFKELAASAEGFATNLLSARLKLLVSLEVLTKRKLPENKKVNIYLLTEKGLDLAPIILELALWSDKHVRESHPDMLSYKNFQTNKKQVIQGVQKSYREFYEEIVG